MRLALAKNEGMVGRWTAEVGPESMIVRVAPDGDYLPDALDTLLSPVRQRFYVAEYIGTDATGWDVYEVLNTAYLSCENNPDFGNDCVTVSWQAC